MAFGRRINGAPGAGDSNGETLPVHIVRLINAMQAIYDDAADIASAIRNGRPLPSPVPGMPLYGPIRSEDSEKLFQHLGENGETLFTTYYFTTDLKTLDPRAQYFLSVLYQRILSANMLINGMGGQLKSETVVTLKVLLDEILAKSAYYTAAFKSHNLVADLLGHRVDAAAGNQAMQRYASDFAVRMREAKALMFQPARIVELAPDPNPCLMVAASGPYQEGQRVINGVFFKREFAEPMMEQMAMAQAGAMSHRA